MEMFLLSHEVARLDGTSELYHPWTAITLAWHLRERNPARAELLATRSEELRDVGRKAPDPRIQARARLIRAEGKLLHADYGAARDLAASSRALFDKLGDNCGSFDACWVLAQAAHERGCYEEAIVLLEDGGKRARAVGDALRIAMAHVGQCLVEGLDGRRSNCLSAGKTASTATVLAPLAWELAAKGMTAFEKRDFAKAIEFGATAHDAAVRTGQLRQGIFCAALVGRAFTELKDQRGAMEWMSDGLALARTCAGPERIFPCLMNVLEAIEPLPMPDETRRLTDEALRMASATGDAEDHLLLRHIQGNQALKRRDHHSALAHFTQMELHADLLGRVRWRIESRCGRAVALERLRLPIDALAAAQAALALARDDNDQQRQISAMKLVSELHRRYAMPDPERPDADDACLHYLLRARDLAHSTADFPSLFELLGAIAREYAKSGDHAHAYRVVLHQIRAGKKCEVEEADRRSAALRARHCIELLRLAQRYDSLRGGATDATQGELFNVRVLGNASADDDAQFVRFVAGASHKLRQPLHAVGLYLETFSSFVLNEPALGALTGMRKCLQALENIFLSLLDLACVQAEAMRPASSRFPIMEILAELTRECVMEARLNMIGMRVVPCSSWVQCDKHLLRKMLYSLASTALQNPGTVRVTIGCRRNGERLRVAIYAAGDVAVGEADGFRASAFDGVSSNGEALTLHLALARRLGALLLCPVKLAWLPRGGFVAAFDLPFAPAETLNTVRPVSKALDATLDDKLIVVIEDDVLVRSAMRAALELHGCIVVMASSYIEVMETLCDSISVPDALVCDFRLQDGATGLDAIHAMRSEFNADIPALVITAEPSAPELRAVSSENIPILAKPLQFSLLKEALASILLT
ncbi:MAG TPA: response regulator [Burkholderiaceae bacterium]|jgi:signal transduction histidine kinase